MDTVAPTGRDPKKKKERRDGADFPAKRSRTSCSQPRNRRRVLQETHTNGHSHENQGINCSKRNANRRCMSLLEGQQCCTTSRHGYLSKTGALKGSQACVNHQLQSIHGTGLAESGRILGCHVIYLFSTRLQLHASQDSRAVPGLPDTSGHQTHREQQRGQPQARCRWS